MAGKSTLAAVAGFAVGLPLVRQLWRVRGEIGAGSNRVGSQNDDGRFHNTEPATELVDANAWAIARSMFGSVGDVRPSAAVPLGHSDFQGAAKELAVTWLGHASVLFEIDGHAVLADPVWGDRVSPSTWLGPARLHPAPVGLPELPDLDAVVISHDHYDHLERSTIIWLAENRRCQFVVPLGLGGHLRGWGVDPARITELNWGQSTRVGELELVCTEVRHFSGRGLRRNDTLWSGWAILGPTRRAYFGGDSGYSACFAATGAEFGPFDVTALPIGAYSEYWPDVHMNPEEALRAHRDLNPGDLNPGAATALLPIHWATFVLSRHGWAEPIERIVAAADEHGGASVLVPRPGERTVVLDADAVAPTRTLDPWWRELAQR